MDRKLFFVVTTNEHGSKQCTIVAAPTAFDATDAVVDDTCTLQRVAELTVADIDDHYSGVAPLISPDSF
jgi:hypothetical protein